MDEQALRSALETLHTELARGHVREAATVEAMRAVARDIETALAHDEPAGLRTKLEGVVTELEAEHPELAALTRRVIGALSSMGI